MNTNYPTEDEHCWCGEHGCCPTPEPAYCYEKIKRSGIDPRPFKVCIGERKRDLGHS